MQSKMNNVSAVAPAESFRSRRSVPKRGQIKMRIATNALHSIAYVLSKTSYHHRFNGKHTAETFRSRRVPSSANKLTYTSNTISARLVAYGYSLSGTYISSRGVTESRVNMESKIFNVPEAATAESFRCRRPLPKRGQVKSRMAMIVLHSIVSMLSRTSGNHYHSSVKCY
ncbi:hypothetical protein POM88_033631 [Heracleum sosnowskyi]|uniref:Uncharacterized protein n=1 Tax=Heracleum sosnowskyi TaxID=360622 RepID=A0AAD8HI21_9APIA|nr:hypothetical protein POM88_033631 [Heracleum sosnowskyi]